MIEIVVILRLRLTEIDKISEILSHSQSFREMKIYMHSIYAR